MQDPAHRALTSELQIRPLPGARLAPLALLLMLTAGCLGLPNPLTRVDAPSLLLLDVRPIRGGTLEQRLELELLVQNPNNFDVVLDGMRLDLEMNGQRVARAVSSQSLSIGRLGETRVAVQASITMLDVARSLLLLASREPSGPITYRVAGDIFVVQPRSTRVAFDDSGEVLPGRSSPAR